MKLGPLSLNFSVLAQSSAAGWRTLMRRGETKARELTLFVEFETL
jgi:hypothetical protein